MKRLFLSAALLFVVFVTGFAPAQDILKIRDGQVESVKLNSKLQGRWNVVGMQKDGKRVAEEDFRGERVLVRENRLVMTKPDGDAIVCRFRVDATKNPIHIDLTMIDHDDKARTLPGIIDQDGETVRIIVNPEPGGDRPTTLRTAGNRTIVVLELQRMKGP